MVARIGPQLQDALIRLLVALSDGQAARSPTIMSGLGEKRECWDPALFEREVDLPRPTASIAVLGNMESGRVVGELARIAGECGLRPPSELTMLSKALLNLDQVAGKLDSNFDPRAAVREHVGEIMRRKMLQSASPANLLAAAIDAKEFVERLPGRVNKVMDALAEGQLTLNIQGIDEKELMRGVQKLANRVSAGVIIAALIIGAAMLMRIDTRSKLFGYPSIAIVCFLAGRAGRSLVDRHQPDARSPPATATPPALSHVPPVNAGGRRGEECEGHRPVVSTHQGRTATFGCRVVGVGER